MGSISTIKSNYRKYRWFFTSSGNLVIGGKNAEQNEELLFSILNEKADFIIMHTTEPGSPFSVIFEKVDKLSGEEYNETAIFTACFSQAWKKPGKKASVDIFRSGQLHKDKSMKTGTWRVSGKVRRILVPLELSLIRQKNTLRAVPKLSFKDKKKILLNIIPGKKDKLEFASEISAKYALNKNHLISALPSGGIGLQNE